MIFLWDSFCLLFSFVVVFPVLPFVEVGGFGFSVAFPKGGMGYGGAVFQVFPFGFNFLVNFSHQ